MIYIMYNQSDTTNIEHLRTEVRRIQLENTICRLVFGFIIVIIIVIIIV
jgi:hypothetical protein